MSDFDPLKMRLAGEEFVGAETPPPITIGRFAPYQVWMSMRIATMIGTGMALLWWGWAIAALFSAVSGGDLEILPWWIGIVGIIVGGSDKGFRRDENIPLFGEVLGRALASKQCPACGQSIFDHTPPSGYQPDLVTRSWWPSRTCTNCGHDMAIRTAT